MFTAEESKQVDKRTPRKDPNFVIYVTNFVHGVLSVENVAENHRKQSFMCVYSA